MVLAFYLALGLLAPGVVAPVLVVPPVLVASPVMVLLGVLRVSDSPHQPVVTPRSATPQRR